MYSFCMFLYVLFHMVITEFFFFWPHHLACGITRKKSYDQLRQHVKKQRHYFADKGSSNQIYGSSNSHVWM